jgi:hypothetical protein
MKMGMPTTYQWATLALMSTFAFTGMSSPVTAQAGAMPDWSDAPDSAAPGMLALPSGAGR